MVEGVELSCAAARRAQDVAKTAVRADDRSVPRRMRQRLDPRDERMRVPEPATHPDDGGQLARVGWLVNVASAARLATITATIILLVLHQGTAEHLVVSRMSEVAGGVLVAIAVARIVAAVQCER